jgi:hypothetical protein
MKKTTILRDIIDSYNSKGEVNNEIEISVNEESVTATTFDQKDSSMEVYVIIPDIHSYDKDDVAFDLMMKSLPILGKKYNVTKFVQLGDLLECGSLSSHPVSSIYDTPPSYLEEINWAVNDFWKPAMKALPNADFYALLGNHEDRLDKWLARNIGRSDLAQSIFETYTPRDLYESMGINVTPYGLEQTRKNCLFLRDDLICIHGWSHSENAAKAHLDKAAGKSVIFGHTHRIQSHIKRDPLSDKHIGAWSFGALAKTNMMYQKGIPCNHVLGFGMVFVHGDDFFVHTIPITSYDDSYRKLILPTGDVLVGKSV